jgi:tetratricopeptide (TPR) repeat protein
MSSRHLKSTFFSLMILGACMFLTSCGGKKNNDLDAGLTDSVNAKYKDNTELQSINKKLLDNPSVDSLYHQRAKIYLKLSDYELALGDANRALNLDSSTSKNYLLLTDIYYVTNQTRKAKETLERCLKNLPQDKDANLKMAELYFYVKKYQESLDHINKAISIDPYMSKAYFLKGMNYMETGDTAKAISSMQTAVEQDNNYYTAYMQLGLLHYYKKNKLCVDYFDNALRLKPKSTEALYAKGRYLQETGKIKEAREFYLQILSLDPTYKSALYNLGAIALGNMNDPETAKKYFTDALSADQNYTEAWFARGVCYEKLNDRAAALKDYKMALKITSNYEPAIAAINKLER